MQGLIRLLSRTDRHFLDCSPATVALLLSSPMVHQAARILAEAVLLGVFWPLAWGYVFVLAPIISCFCRADICEAKEDFQRLLRTTGSLLRCFFCCRTISPPLSHKQYISHPFRECGQFSRQTLLSTPRIICFLYYLLPAKQTQPTILRQRSFVGR